MRLSVSIRSICRAPAGCGDAGGAAGKSRGPSWCLSSPRRNSTGRARRVEARKPGFWKRDQAESSGQVLCAQAWKPSPQTTSTPLYAGGELQGSPCRHGHLRPTFSSCERVKLLIREFVARQSPLRCGFKSWLCCGPASVQRPLAGQPWGAAGGTHAAPAGRLASLPTPLLPAAA